MQQLIHSTQQPIHTVLALPSSSSMSCRALLMAALADGVSEISGLRINRTTINFIKILQQIGIVAQLDTKERSCIIAGGGQFPNKQTSIWCGNSKMAVCFMLAACAASPGVYYFYGSTTQQKNLSRLLNVLVWQGTQFIPNDTYQLPFTLIGADSLEGGEIELDEQVDNQMLSALLMIAPYGRSSFNFIFPHPSQRPDIDITCAMMAHFGVLVHRIHHGQCLVPVPQRYHAIDYTIEPDCSIAIYFFAAAALTGGQITIKHINHFDCRQPDNKFLSQLKKMGCSLTQTKDGLCLQGPAILKSIDITLPSLSHAFIILTALAPFAALPCHIACSKTLNKNESRRLEQIKTELTKLHIQYEASDNGLKISPCKPIGTLVDTHGDYRIGMMLALIGLKTPNLVIDHPACIAAKLPSFFSLWNQLSATIGTTIQT